MNPKLDPRNIVNGDPIPKENYCDQPYVAVRSDGAWVCVLTTGVGVEGAYGQHVISTISYDKGKSWTAPVDIEKAEPPESSWVMPYITSFGRIYAFYVFNKDNLRSVKMKNAQGYTTRVDTMGALCYRYSDDGGAHWSKDRHYVPIRNFTLDEENPYGGTLQFFWGVGKPIRHKNAMILGFAKVGVFGEGFMERDEGAFIRCPNIETERDPQKLAFETLPEGMEGLKAPEGLVADEHNPVSLGDGSLFCTFRTVAGHNAQSYSRDDGKTWSTPEFACQSPGGRLFKHPRAANFVRRYENGKYTLWFHNHGKNLVGNPGTAYLGRNPVWICGGEERGGFLYWSEPEILLYSENPTEGMSYPDFIEADGDVYITETQKTIARVHKADPAVLDAIWNKQNAKELAREGLVLDVLEPSQGDYPIPPSILPCEGDCFSLQLLLDTENLTPGVLLDGRNALLQGIRLDYTQENTVALRLNDGERELVWECDPLSQTVSHITAIFDSRALVLSFVVDGKFCDGGTRRDYGFGRIDRNMKELAGKGALTLGENAAHVKRLRFYNRYLLTAEAAGNYRSDMERKF